MLTLDQQETSYYAPKHNCLSFNIVYSTTTNTFSQLTKEFSVQKSRVMLMKSVLAVYLKFMNMQ